MPFHETIRIPEPGVHESLWLVVGPAQVIAMREELTALREEKTRLDAEHQRLRNLACSPAGLALDSHIAHMRAALGNIAKSTHDDFAAKEARRGLNPLA